jgi:hypothetical protein
VSTNEALTGIAYSAIAGMATSIVALPLPFFKKVPAERFWIFFLDLLLELCLLSSLLVL